MLKKQVEKLHVIVKSMREEINSVPNQNNLHLMTLADMKIVGGTGGTPPEPRTGKRGNIMLRSKHLPHS